MTYELHLPGVTRHLPICPVNEKLSFSSATPSLPKDPPRRSRVSHPRTTS